MSFLKNQIINWGPILNDMWERIHKEDRIPVATAHSKRKRKNKPVYVNHIARYRKLRREARNANITSTNVGGAYKAASASRGATTKPSLTRARVPGRGMGSNLARIGGNPLASPILSKAKHYALVTVQSTPAQP